MPAASMRNAAKNSSFLLSDGRLMPSIEIARRWGLAQKTVTAYRRRMGVHLSWEEARSSEDYRRQQRKRAAAFVAHTRERWKQWRERKRLTWEKLRRQLAQRPDCPPERVCQGCGERWYAAREFFHARTRNSAAGVRINYCRVCRLCRAERRRKPSTALVAAGA